MTWTAKRTFVPGEFQVDPLDETRLNAFDVQRKGQRQHVVWFGWLQWAKIPTEVGGKPLTRAMVDEAMRRARHYARIDRANRRVNLVLDIWSTLLPSRVVNEELGDYLEDIQRRLKQGKWFLSYLRVFTAIVFTGLNAVEYVLKRVNRGGSMSQEIVVRNIAAIHQESTKVVVLPLACSKCATEFEMECKHSTGFGIMSPGWFRCQTCGEVNRFDALPGEPLRVLPRRRF